MDTSSNGIWMRAGRKVSYRKRMTCLCTNGYQL